MFSLDLLLLRSTVSVQSEPEFPNLNEAEFSGIHNPLSFCLEATKSKKAMATFESLPEELHYEIFKLHFSQNLKVVIHSAPGLSEPVQHSAAILLVSHRIYDRAISVFQDLVVFDVQDTWLCPRLFFRSPIWSANHSAIRNLRVDCLPRLPGDNWTNLFENTIELEPVYQAVPYNDLPNLKKVCLHNRNEYDQLQPENPRRMRIRRSLRNKIFQHIKDDPILASMKTILNVNDREWSIEIVSTSFYLL